MKMAVEPLALNQDKTNSGSSMKYVVWMCCLFTVLILGRAVSNIALYLFVGVSFGVFLFSSTPDCFAFLLFLMPFSAILKAGPESMSFFTLLFFLTTLKMAVEKKAYNAVVAILLLLFAAYALLLSGFGKVTTIITMLFGLLMLYCLRSLKTDASVSVVAFSLGICIASVLALMKDLFPIVNEFIHDNMIRLEADIYTVRFVGLQGNSNYYTMDVVVALSALIVLMYGKRSKGVYPVFMIALSVFGLLSVSKSFLLCWALLIFIWFILSIKQGAGKLGKFLMIVVLGGGIMYFYAYDAINGYLLRFLQDSGGSTMSDITTGRSEIWEKYISAIFNDFKIMFLGNGINTILEGAKGTHNTFLEGLFYLGILGCSLFFASLKTCMGKVITRPIMWVPVIALLIRMMAIGILTYDNLWLYFGLFVVLAKEVEEKKTL